MGSMSWQQKLTDMLVIKERPVLFVPKRVVSCVKELDSSKYYRHRALEFLQENHLRRNASFMQKR